MAPCPGWLCTWPCCPVWPGPPTASRSAGRGRAGDEPAMTRFLICLGNEVRKGLMIAWSEKLQIVFELPFYALLILLLGPLLNAGHEIGAGRVVWSLHSRSTSLLVLALIPAMVLYFQAVKLFWRLLAEIQSGTFEQIYLSPLPSWLVAAAGRVVAALIETLLVMA